MTASAARPRRRPDQVRLRRRENLDFTGAVEFLAERFRVELDTREDFPSDDAEAPPARPPQELLAAGHRLLRALPLGWPVGAHGAGVPGRPKVRRGDLPHLPPRVRARWADAPKAREQGSRRTSCSPPGSSTVAATTTSAADRLPARRRARPRTRLPGPQAARGRPASGEVRQLARERPVPQGRRPLRARPARARRSPGKDRAVVVEGNTDVIALRQEGLEPSSPAMGTALTDRHSASSPADPEPLAVLRRRGGRGGDAARDGAGRRAGLRARSHASGRLDPADLPAASSLAPGVGRAVPLFTACGSRSTGPPTAQEASSAFVRPGAVRGLAGPGRTPSGPAVRPARPTPRDSGRARAVPTTGGATRLACPPSSSYRADRYERDALAACIAHPGLVRVARRARARALRLRAARASCATTSSPGRRRPTTLFRCTPSSMRAPPRRGSTRRPPSSCCCGSASAGSSGSCKPRTPSTFAICRSRCRRSARPSASSPDRARLPHARRALRRASRLAL